MYNNMLLKSFVMIAITTWGASPLFAASNPPCATCVSVKADGGPKEFESCTPQNNYLEKKIEQNKNLSPLKELITSKEETPQFPKKCLSTFLDKNPRGFASCESNSGMPKLLRTKPCVSPNYFNMVYNSFTNVTSCFGINPKEVTPKLFRESSFHANAYNYQKRAGRVVHGGTGFGQITQSAISQVNQTYFSSDGKMKDTAIDSNNNSCNQIKTVTSHSPRLSQRCGFLSMPENPLRNMVYVALYLKENRRIVDAILKSRKIFEKIQAKMKDSLDAKKKENLTHIIESFAYNQGPGGAIEVFDQFIKSKASLSIKDFDVQNKGSFAHYAKSHLGSGDPAYILNLQKSKEFIDAQTGAEKCTIKDYLKP